MKSKIFVVGIFMLSLGMMGFVANGNHVNSQADTIAKATDSSLKLLENRKYNFAEFLSYFTKVETPFEIQLRDMEKYQAIKNQQIEQGRLTRTNPEASESFRHFIPELQRKRMTRMGPPEVAPVARFYPNDKMVAVVYMHYYPFWKENVDFRLALFDLNGNSLMTNEQEAKNKSKKKSKFHGAWAEAFHIAHVSVENSSSFVIHSDGRIQQQHFENIWKEDIKEKGIEGNEIVDHKLARLATFQIKPNGLIEQVEVDNRSAAVH